MNYMRFLAGIKKKYIQWKEKEKFQRALTFLFSLEAEKKVKEVKKKYYREKRTCSGSAETSVHLRILTQEVKIEIIK